MPPAGCATGWPSRRRGVRRCCIARFEVGQERRQVASAFQYWTRGLAQIDAHFARDDVRQSGLAETGRAKQQHVIERFGAILGRLDKDRQLFSDLGLADIFVQRTWSQGPFDGFLGGRYRIGRYQSVGLDHQWRPSSLRAARMPSATAMPGSMPLTLANASRSE